MEKLVNKVWWYEPNQYTTIFTLTATWVDGTTSVYTFRKSGSSWSPVGDHDGKLLIFMPTQNVDKFHVRAYADNPFVSLDAEYANEHGSSSTSAVNMTRIHFARTMEEFDTTDVWLMHHDAEGGYPEWNAWDDFANVETPDIFFTNLTDKIVLPNYDRTIPVGQFNGWCVIDDSQEDVKELYRAAVGPKPNLYKVKVSWHHFMNVQVEDGVDATYENWNIVTRDGNQSYFGLKNLLTKQSLGGTYRALPVFYQSGDFNFIKTS